MTQHPPQPASPSDIEESELLDMLQTLIDARCGLSAIHHLLDGTRTMSDIRTRFNQWQAEQRTTQPQPSSHDKTLDRTHPSSQR
jgi:hypothetical protein